MAVYYNNDKKIFIESDLSSVDLKKHGYKDVFVEKLEVGEKLSKKIWVLRFDNDYMKPEVISENGIYYNELYCRSVTIKRVESLNEIRAYFAYLTKFIEEEKIRGVKLMERVEFEHNHFADQIAFERTIQEISYNNCLRRTDMWPKGVNFELIIPLYYCFSKELIEDTDIVYDYEYLYYPFISVLASLYACPDYSFGRPERREMYERYIESLPAPVNYRCSFYNIIGLKLQDIDFDDIHTSYIIFEVAKKILGMMNSVGVDKTNTSFEDFLDFNPENNVLAGCCDSQDSFDKKSGDNCVGKRRS